MRKMEQEMCDLSQLEQVNPAAENSLGILSEMDTLAVEILASMDAIRLQDREAYDHTDWNWASEIHHPCAKHLTHCRRDWKEKQLPGIDALYRFEEGRDKEWKVKQMFGQAGFELQQTQRKFRMEDYKISGRIDGTLRFPSNRRIEFPVEVKSISLYYWDSTRTIQDLKSHPKFWINRIPSQLNLYLLMMGVPAGFLVLVTFGKKPRILPMLFDQDLADLDLRQANLVNRHIEAGTYPHPIPFDSTVCGMCGFNHLCKPLGPSGITGVPESALLEEYLEDYCNIKEYYKEAKKEFDKIHAKLVGNESNPGYYFGKSGFVNDIEIKTNIQNRKKHTYPNEIKEKYEEAYQLIITTIDRMVP